MQIKIFIHEGYNSLSELYKYRISIKNNEIIFKNNETPNDSHPFYFIYLDDFKVHEKNHIARMMLADAILKTHPFTL
jgi:hypothetical protein